ILRSSSAPERLPSLARASARMRYCSDSRKTILYSKLVPVLFASLYLVGKYQVSLPSLTSPIQCCILRSSGSIEKLSWGFRATLNGGPDSKLHKDASCVLSPSFWGLN